MTLLSRTSALYAEASAAVPAELLQLLRAHIGDDDRDQKCDQRDDRNGSESRVVNVSCDRDRTPNPRILQRRQKSDRRGSEKRQAISPTCQSLQGVATQMLHGRTRRALLAPACRFVFGECLGNESQHRRLRRQKIDRPSRSGSNAEIMYQPGAR